jgi:hypothetical protein
MRIFIALYACALLANLSAAQNQTGRRTVGSPPPELHGTFHPIYDSGPGRPQSFADFVKTADVIVDGNVQSIFPTRLRNSSDPISAETDSLFAVDRVLKGQPEKLRSLVITQVGGKYGEVEVIVDDRPLLKTGERHILFLGYDRRTIVPTYPRTDGNFYILDGSTGNFKVEGNVVKWLAPDAAPTFRKFESGTAEDFIAQIVAAVSASPLQAHADELVQQLRELPTPLPGIAPGNGQIPPIEQRRRQLYRDIRQLGTDALPALQRGLRDNDVQIRRNVALIFMQLVSGYWVDEVRPKLDIRNSLPTLLTALDDGDSNVRAWSAQAIGGIGPDAVNAVPALIRLLKNSDEGSRNSACIALRGIGPSAKEALPALDAALSDSSENVRGFARRAIESIQGH